jgi:defect-in-organelle-trafficking protein DotB
MNSVVNQVAIEQLDISNFDKIAFRNMLIHMHNTKSSDAYLRPDSKIYFKLNGVIVPVTQGIVETSKFEHVITLITNEAVKTVIKTGKPHGMGYTVKKATLKDGTVSNLRYRMQIASTSARESMVVVIREIPIVPPTPFELGLEQGIIDVQMEFRHGVGFVCGATNSGKSTSIASLIRVMLETIPKHILSLEDPREFVFDMLVNPRGIITSMEIPDDVSTYDEGIKNSLRMSPDSVFVGEVRDMHTTNALLQVAETGHNVITTLHVARGPQLFQRLASFYEGEQRDRVISKAIEQTNFILVQNLVPKIGGGRVAVREYLIFDADMKRQLQKIASDAVSKIVGVLQDLFLEYGVTLPGDAQRLYNEEIITRETHNTLCSSIGEVQHVIQ